jgi:hypothetical protein
MNTSIARLMTAATVAATGQSAAVDIVDFHGHALIAINASATAASGNTCAITIEESATGSGSWTTVTGLTFTQITNAAASHQVVGVNVDRLKRFLRVVYTLGGTDPEVTLAAQLVGHKQYTTGAE